MEDVGVGAADGDRPSNVARGDADREQVHSGPISETDNDRQNTMNNPSLVCVASQPLRAQVVAGGQPEVSIDLIKEGSLRVGSLTVRYTRIAAHLVGISAAVCRRERAGFAPAAGRSSRS